MLNVEFTQVSRAIGNSNRTAARLGETTALLLRESDALDGEGGVFLRDVAAAQGGLKRDPVRRQQIGGYVR